MLTIRDAQFQSFEIDRDRRFARWMAEHLRVNQRADVLALDDAELERRVFAGVRRTRAHGLREARAVTLFVSLMFRHAPGFDRHPQLAARLASGEGTPDQRFIRLAALTTPEEWDEVQRRRDDGDW